MKYFFLIFSLILFSCNQHDKNEINDVSLDTLIDRNKYNLGLIKFEYKKSDTFIHYRFRNMSYKIDTLTIEIKKLKSEKNEFKTVISDTGDVGRPYLLLPISDDQKNWK